MLVIGLVLLIVAVFSFISRGEFFDTLLKCIGGAIGLVGVASLIYRIIRKSDSAFFKSMHIFAAVLNIVLGILLIYFAAELATAFTIACGVVIVVGAIFLIITNFKYYTSSKVTLAYLIIAVLVLLAGILFIFKPDMIKDSMAIVFGVIAALCGLLFVLQSFRVRKAIKTFNKTVEDAIAQAEAEVAAENNIDRNADIEEATIVEEE